MCNAALSWPSPKLARKCLAATLAVEAPRASTVLKQRCHKKCRNDDTTSVRFPHCRSWLVGFDLRFTVPLMSPIFRFSSHLSSCHPSLFLVRIEAATPSRVPGLRLATDLWFKGILGRRYLETGGVAPFGSTLVGVISLGR